MAPGEIAVSGLTRLFADGTGLHPVELRLASGEFVAVLGPSGCGKSTLLRCVAGLEHPDAGRVVFGDRVMYDADNAIDISVRDRGLGMVFQDLALWPHLTAEGNVGFPLKVAGVDKTEAARRVAEMLERVDLTDAATKSPHQLSGGQQQRVAIARALIAHPQLLLLDEPFSALDAALRIRLRSELRELTRQLQVTTVFVTHDQTEAMSMSDRVVVMDAGRIAQVAAPEQLYRHPADRFVAEFVGAVNDLPAGGAIRPEAVRVIDGPAGPVGPDRPGTTVTGVVEESVYVGGTFELRCRIPDVARPWLVRSLAAHPIGAEIALAVDATEPILPTNDHTPIRTP